MRSILLLAAVVGGPLFPQDPVSAGHAQRESGVALLRPAPLPCAIASFGAATAGTHVYVYGGHVGRAHRHSRDNLVGSFQRLDLSAGKGWEALPADRPVQGTALVAGPNGELIRVAGLDARNESGAPEDLHSVAEVVRFDAESNRWTQFVPLPEPRSSHDAVVVDGKLYVVGGWRLAGDDEPEWHKTAWVCDLTAFSPSWTPVPAPPFVRRACAIAGLGRGLVVVGGMDERGPTSGVWILDPALGDWRRGPELPGPGFGAAALGVGDAVFASALDGRVFRLDLDATQWVCIGTLGIPRFFHRFALTPNGTELVALGGASRSGHLSHVEFVPLAADARARIHEWRVGAEHEATHRFALLLHGDALHMFGGNRGAPGDRFDPQQFTTHAVALDLGVLRARPLPALPLARQSMLAVSFGPGSDENLLLGGIGPDREGGTEVRASAETLRFDTKSGTVALTRPLPSPRTQFQALVHDGKVWIFGGTDFAPDGDGRGEATYPLDVLVTDPKLETLRFEVAEKVRLPGARRSFGAAVVGDTAYLIGGLGAGFAAADGCVAFDFVAQRWRRLPSPPHALVSPQVAAIGDRLYVACGGTMTGQAFLEDRALYSFDESAGWRTVVSELPFSTRHVQMRALRDRLLFVDLRESGVVIVRTLRPEGAPTVVEAAFHR